MSGPLKGFAPNSQGRRVWSLAPTSLKVKVNFGGLRAVYVWKNIFAWSSFYWGYCCSLMVVQWRSSLPWDKCEMPLYIIFVDWLIGLRLYVPLDSFQTRSSQPVSSLSREESKPNTTKANNARIKWPIGLAKPENTQKAKTKRTHKMLNLNQHPTKNCKLKTKFHYAILVADRSEAGRRHASSLLASCVIGQISARCRPATRSATSIA